MKRIGIIGTLVVDYLCTYVDKMPELGGHIDLDDFNVSTGGNAGNTAVNLARMGVDIEYFGGAVGNDKNGEFILELFSELKIPLDGIKIQKESKTGVSIVNIASSKDKRINQLIGANGTFKMEDVNFDMLLKLDYIIISGFILMESLLEDMEKLLSFCSQNNIITIGGLTAINRSDLKEKNQRIMKYFDYLFLNDLEARYYTDYENIEEQTNQLQQNGAKNIIVTQGQNGVYILGQNGDIINLGAIPVHVYDTTGAGDAYMSGFIYGLLHEKNLRKCAELGLFTASKCIEKISASEGLMNLSLQAYL